MKIILLIISLTISLNSFTFEWHGFKSGMTEEKVKELTGEEEVKKKNCYGDCTTSYFEKRGVEKPPELWSINFKFTSESELYQIDMEYIELSGLNGIVQNKILKDLFPDFEILKKSTGYTSLLVATLADTKLFEEDIERLYNQKIDKY